MRAPILTGSAAPTVALTCALLAAHAPAGAVRGRDWPEFGGGPERWQYSPLAQIHTGNVDRLRVAWIYRTGDASPEGRSQIQCNPIVVRGVLYGTSPRLRLFALDAASGRERWVFDPFAAGGEPEALNVNRGVVYWEDEHGGGARIFYAAGRRLYAIDATTGRPIESFGERGSLDLGDGLGHDVRGLPIFSTTPGAVFEDLLIVGTRVGEGPAPAAPGHIRAFDARTGRLRWRFHTIPHPGEFGYETWPPDAWRRAGGANAWSGMSVDRRRGLVFVPTGSAAFDFWGGDRRGANLFANSVLALRARTGARAWHYQIVRHDLLDRDLPAAPVLAAVRRGGRLVDAVVQITKTGHVWLFDRDTGRPLVPVDERAVPPSDLEGEAAWPTQPFPRWPAPFARQAFTEREVTDRSPEAHAWVLARLRGLRSGGPYMPPSEQGTVVFPGFDGGGEWGGAAFDQETRTLYVNGNEMAWILTMVRLDRGSGLGRRVYQVHCAACHGLDRRGDLQRAVPGLTALGQRLTRAEAEAVVLRGRGLMPGFGALTAEERRAVVSYLFGDEPPASARRGENGAPPVPYTHTGYNRFLDPEGYPAVKPPWGTLNAIDLDTGRYLWRVPLGEFRELTARGVPPTGTENYGGPVVTAGGLVFIGATKDERFRAFDKRTGRRLWETALPAGGYATPAVYAVGGRQFIVIAAGGGKMGTRSGDAYVAFALPES
ncbi:MAG TPA: PQQ-binding-like beta-propeller repeat protein [Vicinamibacterales bacterium]|nr:PQQ-binding-like beta-propeller repeat protein [Vicinamibacterales bacterium]